MKIKIQMLVISIIFFCITINGMETTIKSIKPRKLASLAKGTEVLILVKKTEKERLEYEKVLLGEQVPNTDYYSVYYDTNFTKGTCCHNTTFYKLIEKK